MFWLKDLYFTLRIPFRLMHSSIHTAFKAYSSANKHRLPSSIHAQYNCLDWRLCFLFLARALLYKGLKKMPARRWGARLSVSPPDDENDVMRTVRGRGWLKYTLAFRILCCRFCVVFLYFYIVLRLLNVYGKNLCKFSHLKKKNIYIICYYYSHYFIVKLM